MILDANHKRWPWIKRLLADRSYDRLQSIYKAAYLKFIVDIVHRRDDGKGFKM